MDQDVRFVTQSPDWRSPRWPMPRRSIDAQNPVLSGSYDHPAKAGLSSMAVAPAPGLPNFNRCEHCSHSQFGVLPEIRTTDGPKRGSAAMYLVHFILRLLLLAANMGSRPGRGEGNRHRTGCQRREDSISWLGFWKWTYIGYQWAGRNSEYLCG